jgi:hypothetical protein
MKWKRFFHTLRFLHFSDNRNVPDQTDENYDRLWETSSIFVKLNTKETQMVWDKNLHAVLF